MPSSKNLKIRKFDKNKLNSNENNLQINSIQTKKRSRNEMENFENFNFILNNRNICKTECSKKIIKYDGYFLNLDTIDD